MSQTSYGHSQENQYIIIYRRWEGVRKQWPTPSSSLPGLVIAYCQYDALKFSECKKNNKAASCLKLGQKFSFRKPLLLFSRNE